MTTLLLATLLTVKFPGGNPNEFALMLVESTKQNVVISQSEAKLIPKAEFATADLDEMARAIRTQTGHAILPGTDLVLSDQLLARRLVGERSRRIRSVEAEVDIRVAQIEIARGVPSSPDQGIAINFIGLTAKALHNGLVDFKTEKSDALQASTLGGGLSKSTKAHWIYDRVPIYVFVTGMPEIDFVKWAARSIGARLLVGPKEYSFELDPIEIRKRAIATIQKEPALAGRREDAAIATKAKNFRIACLNALNAAQITEALKSPGSRSRIELGPRNALTRMAVQHIRDLEQYQLAAAEGGRGSRNAVGLLRRVDGSRMAALIVDSQFDVEVEVPVLDRDGRPAGVVRI